MTAYGRARVLEDEPLAPGVIAVEIEVDRVQDHDRPTFEIQSGVGWRWTDADAERRDADVRAALARLAGVGPERIVGQQRHPHAGVLADQHPARDRLGTEPVPHAVDDGVEVAVPG